MSTIQDGGIRIFSVPMDFTTATTMVYAQDSLENEVNSFLQGDGTLDEPLKMIVGDPQLWIETSGAHDRMYVLIQYKRVN